MKGTQKNTNLFENRRKKCPFSKKNAPKIDYKDKKNQISCLSRFYNKSFPQNIIQHIYSDFDKINDYSNFLKGCNIVIHLAAISNNLKNTKSNI